MLTLAGHLQNTSIGTDLSPETLQLLRSLADSTASMSPSCGASASRWKDKLARSGEELEYRL